MVETSVDEVGVDGLVLCDFDFAAFADVCGCGVRCVVEVPHTARQRRLASRAWDLRSLKS